MATELVQRRGRMLTAITKLKNYANTIDANATLEDIEVRQAKIEDYFKEFTSIENKLLLIEGQVSKFEDFESNYYHIKAIFTRELRKRQPAPPAPLSDNDLMNRTIDNLCAQQRTFFDGLKEHSFTQTTQEVRLPRVTIEPFSGSYNLWPSFKDLYKSSVHSNDALTDVHRFQLLKSFLRGDAADLIRYIPVTDANYTEAWEILVSRYDKKKSVVNSLIEKFMSQKSMSEFKHCDLRKIADVSDAVTRELKCLGTVYEKRDPWLIFLTLNKVDMKTREAWATHCVDMDAPSYEELLKFMHKRCDTYEFCTTPKSQGQRSSPASRASIHTTLSDPQSCACCSKGFHALYKCFKFKKLSIPKRIELVRKSNSCINCLSSQHSTEECPSQILCKLCNLPHNTLLHEGSSKNSNPTNINTLDSATTAPNVPNSTSINTIVTPFHPNATINTVDFSPINIVDFSPINTTVESSSINLVDSSNTILQSTGSAAALVPSLTNGTPKSMAFFVQHPSLTILPTALIRVKASNGTYQQFRALLDSGAQTSLITEKCIQSLNLPRSHACLNIKGLSSACAGQTKGQVQLQVLKSDRDTFSIRAYVLTHLTSRLPQVPVDLSRYQQIKSLKLADSTFDRPGSIDIILGSDIFFQLLQPERYQLDQNLFAQNTYFGFVIAGEMPTLNDVQDVESAFNYHVDIHEQMQKFWEIEDISSPTTNSDCPAESHFIQNTVKDVESNKYVVKLPFKENFPDLGISLPMALKRLYAMEKRFTKNGTLREEYNNFLREYHSLGHMTKIPFREIERDPRKTFYLPHHAVFKESSSTTKLRVVFDGSSKSMSGVSLNDILDPGPSILQELFSILVRFRKHRVGIAADVEKMFRQILVAPTERDFQRIVWRESPDHPIAHFRLNTVTYGTASATFLAVRTLHQIADDLPPDLTEIANTIKSDFYVDDLITGADTVHDAINLQEKVCNGLMTGGFRLRKWISNSSELLSSVPEAEREKMVEFGDGQLCVKTLGLTWITQNDTFTFKINCNTEGLCNTKRSLLSTTASIFDPLGFLAPCTITAKMLFQSLWLHKLNWDEPLPPKLNSDWQRLRSSFALFDRIKIPRFLSIPSSSQPRKLELHGFSDSSEKAFAAAVYLRSIDSKGKISVNLVSSKTKVAPLKSITLPRLELCGAVLVVKLLLKVKNALDIPELEMFGWTDSTIVLAWLTREPIKWKSFIANRTSFILQHLPREKWEHVPSEMNPADCASRGISPEKLGDFSLWWNGPSYLLLSPQQWPSLDLRHSNNDFSAEDLEAKKTTKQILTFDFQHPSDDVVEPLFSRYSTFMRPIRVLAQCLRFIDNLNGPKKSFFLASQHLKHATQLSIKWSQAQCFDADMKMIARGHDLPRTSKLKALAPFIDEMGILRVGGRIGLTTSLSYDVRHPIILDKGHDFTTKLVSYLHGVHLHPTKQQLAAILRQTYWVVGARLLVQKITRACTVCQRYQLQTSQQQMSNIPEFRLKQTKPFSLVGVDFAGPVKVKSRSGRGAKFEKGYIAVFVCLVVKAIHIEVVSDLSTEAFIACLRRFISRRGMVNCIYSDNGSNFVGAKRRLSQLHDACAHVDDEKIVDFLAPQQIQWHLIPPSSPHFGGMWEAGVKSVKRHLIRTIGETALTFEEYATILTQIECLLNSRPIAPMTTNVDENSELLTPGHFLMGSSPMMIPEPPTTNEPRSYSSRWQLLQGLMRGFWRIWHTEYLTSLHQRGKWQTKSPNFCIGDIVIIKDNNSPPGQWTKGIILETHPGKDGLVRVVTLKTMKGVYKRPITKLCLFKTVKEYQSLNPGEYVSDVSKL